MSPKPLFMVGVDTEADDQWTLEGRKRLSVENARALPRLQTVCDAFGVRPSYLVTHEMATREPARSILRDLAATGRCEIGAHLHPWSSPPYREEDLAGRYPSQLDEASLETQLRELTSAIEASLGVRPRSYRAGRHGFDTRSLRILEELGYLVDTSVDPLFN
jgi:Polysaccharide deacetylase